MTDESQQHQCASRRCVLLGAGVLGVAGVLTACSTAAVPYNANDAGQAPGTTPSASGSDAASAMATQPSSSASAKSGGSMNGSGQMGTVLGMASAVPVGEDDVEAVLRAVLDANGGALPDDVVLITASPR